MERVADVLRPMMLKPPPALGSKHPGDVLELLREAGRAAGLSPARPAGALPRDDDVGRRPARRLVRERRAQGRLRVDRRGRRVGRPAHARHGLQPAPPRARRARRRRRRVGPRARRDGRDLARRSRRSARAFGATIRTDAAVASDRRRATAACTASRSPTASRSAPRSCSPARTRRRPCSTSSAASTSPTRSSRTCERYRSRGGSVKVNWILSEPPQLQRSGRAAAHEPRDLPEHRLPRARLAGRDARQARRGPVHRGRGPDGDRPVADRRRHDRDDDVHPVRPARRGRLARGRARGLRACAAWTSSPSTRPTSATRSCTTRCSRRPTSSASSGSSAARSSRASRAWTRWRSCARRRCSRATRRRSHGLYLCGAGTHPGGGVIAAAGHNAAQRVLKDRRKRRFTERPFKALSRA